MLNQTLIIFLILHAHVISTQIKKAYSDQILGENHFICVAIITSSNDPQAEVLSCKNTGE